MKTPPVHIFSQEGLSFSCLVFGGQFTLAGVSRGGEGGIRTRERGFGPVNRLAGGPNQPLWHLPNYLITDPI
jgi:hypothetical protein